MVVVGGGIFGVVVGCWLLLRFFCCAFVIGCCCENYCDLDATKALPVLHR